MTDNGLQRVRALEEFRGIVMGVWTSGSNVTGDVQS